MIQIVMSSYSSKKLYMQENDVTHFGLKDYFVFFPILFLNQLQTQQV